MLSSLIALRNRVRRLPIVRKIKGLDLAGKVFLVGGALRELALARLPNDYDFAIERASDLRAFEKVFGAHAFLLGKRPAQTHRIVAGDVTLDITMLQGGLEADLLRRDFTINAMAYDVKGESIIDPLQGWKDLEGGVIRYPRKESLEEDPLRMVKAIRHLAAMRGFSLAPEVNAAISDNGAWIHRAAAERIKYELDLILLAKDVHRGVEALRRTGLLFEIFPELKSLLDLDREKGLEPQALGHTLGAYQYMGRVRRFHPLTDREAKHVAYALLFHDLGKAQTFSWDEEKGQVHFIYHERFSCEIASTIMARLRFGASEARAILNLIENHMRLFLISNRNATEKATRRLVYKMEDLTPSLVWLTLLDLYGSSKGRENASSRGVRQKCREVLAAHAERLKDPLPHIVDGYDLMALGFTQGPTLGRVLQEIREKQIAGEMTGKEEALEYARNAASEDVSAVPS